MVFRSGAEGWCADTMGEAHPRMISAAQPTKSNPDKARGVGPEGRRGEAPEQKAYRPPSFNFAIVSPPLMRYSIGSMRSTPSVNFAVPSHWKLRMLV